MKNALLLLSCALLGGVAGALSTRLLDAPGERRGEASAGAEPTPAVAALEKTLAELRTRLNALDERLAQEPLAAPAPIATRAPEISQSTIEQAVASYLERNGTVLGSASSPPQGAGQELSAIASTSTADLVDLLTEGDLDGLEEQELWESIRKSGRMDEVLAEYERLAEMQPGNPDVQSALGTAYIQKIFDVGSGPLAGKFGALADAAYDRALEADPEHWEARFSKAVALSNWPEFLGKTGEAIHQFETLVAQQEEQQAKPHFAQTYFILGNMHQRKGDSKTALEVWRRGLDLFPDDDDLREQIRVNE